MKGNHRMNHCCHADLFLVSLAVDSDSICASNNFASAPFALKLCSCGNFPIDHSSLLAELHILVHETFFAASTQHDPCFFVSTSTSRHLKVAQVLADACRRRPYTLFVIKQCRSVVLPLLRALPRLHLGIIGHPRLTKPSFPFWVKIRRRLPDSAFHARFHLDTRSTLVLLLIFAFGTNFFELVGHRPPCFDTP